MGVAPVRMCRICRQRRPKAQLHRWVVGPHGYEADPKQNRPGRGVYTDSEECVQKLTRIKVKP